MNLTRACLLFSAISFVAGPTLAEPSPSTTTTPPSATLPAPPAPATAPEPAAPDASQTPAAAIPPAPPSAEPAMPTPPPPALSAWSIPPPPAGKSQVVFFRPSGFSGAAVWFNVRENGVALGKLSNGAYFVQITDPGPHTYTAATENHNVLKLEVDDGETEYVKGSVQMGFFIGEAAMTPSDQATFEKALKHMHLAAAPAQNPKDVASSAPISEPGK